MPDDLTARIATALFLPGIAEYFRERAGTRGMTCSPLVDATPLPAPPGHLLRIRRGRRDWAIAVTAEAETPVARYLREEGVFRCRHLLAMVTGKLVNTDYAPYMAAEQFSMPGKETRLDFAGKDEALRLRVVVPVPLLAEAGIDERFFESGKWMIPDLGILLQSLDEGEVAALVGELQRNLLISTYQIFLLVRSCGSIWRLPELALKIKHAVSKNTLRDVMAYTASLPALRLRGRDLREGIYSVQEAVFFLLKKKRSFPSSRFLSDMKELKRIIEVPVVQSTPRHNHPEHFDFLLAGLPRDTCYTLLLHETGWFPLATALKGIPGHLRQRVLGSVPPEAGALIEDVVQGILNPNILHDEMQINKAKIVCARALEGLIARGLVRFDGER